MAGVEDAFLQDIRAHPDDDARRVIYADWLEEHGNSTRGEFIRAQCALASDGADPRFPVLQDRTQQLEAKHPEWRENFARACEDAGLVTQNLIRLQRGFPVLETVRLTSSFHGNIQQLLSHPPLAAVLERYSARIGSVDIQTADELRALAASPLRQYVDGLKIWVRTDRQRRSGAVPRNGQQRLDTPDHDIINTLPQVLDSMPHLRRLHIYRHGCMRAALQRDGYEAFGDAGEEELAGRQDYYSRFMVALLPQLNGRKIKELYMGGGTVNNGFTDGHIFTSLAAIRLPELNTLHISSLNLNDTGLNHIIRSGLLKKVLDLSLGQVRLSEDSLHTLGCFGNIRSLRHFHVSSNRLEGNASWLYLPNFEGLTGLHLRGNERLNEGIILHLLDNEEKLLHLRSLSVDNDQPSFGHPEVGGHVGRILANRRGQADRAP